MQQVRAVVEDVSFPEAPRWHEGALWFSDMLAKRVCRLDGDGTVATVAAFDEMPGGLGFLPDGTPIVVGMESARLYAIRDGAPTVHAELSGVAAGHLDDMAVAPDGTAYAGGVGVMAPGAPPDGGSIVRVTPGGEMTVEASGVAFPNGAAFTADGRTLLVNETFGQRVLAFDVEADGTLTNRRSWAELPGLHPDGLCLDAAGAAWVGCYSENRFVRVLRGGAITDTIPAGTRWATGVELGGDDGRTLFMMSADTDLRRFFAGDAAGRIDTVQVDVPSVAFVA
jgi:sugar lactone lactonase YvrE